MRFLFFFKKKIYTRMITTAFYIIVKNWKTIQIAMSKRIPYCGIFTQ